jgi:hypothetical protein
MCLIITEQNLPFWENHHNNNNNNNMNSPRLILLLGYGGAGKDSVRKILQEQHNFNGAAFADGVRACAAELDPLIFVGSGLYRRYNELLAMYGYEEAKRLHPDVRVELVKIGHGLRKALGESIWIDRVVDTIAKSLCAGKSICISDARYPNEADCHPSAEVWYIERPGVGPANDTEAKTIPQVRRDRVVLNDGTLEDLRCKVAEALALVFPATPIRKV